jgi:hypothetical protein
MKTSSDLPAWRKFRSGITACAHRVSLSKMLRERGGFTIDETCAAFYGLRAVNPDGEVVLCSGVERTEIEQRIATWLMGELEKLPKGKTAPEESSPVRRRGLLSRLEISDVAIALLDYPQYYDFYGGWPPKTNTPPIVLHPPTSELIELLSNLLDMTRHRAAFDDSTFPKNWGLAIYIDAMATRCGKKLTGKRLAKLADVSTYTISIWRRSKEYQERLAREVEDRDPIPHPDALDLREQDL